MATEVVMPRLSLTMKEGTVGKWYKEEGEPVEKGEPIVEVISEKATYDLEAPASGILRRIFVREGSDVPVNAVLAMVAAPDEVLTERSETEKVAEAPPEAESRVVASPAAKRLAREHGIDLSLVEGSGPEGRIVEEDVTKHIEQAGVHSPKIKALIPLAGLRKISAERVASSFRTAPHSTLVMEVDVSEAAKLHEKLQISYTAILVKAAAMALVEHPEMNSTLDGDKIKVFEDVNVGVAVATEKGLVVPVVHNANVKPVREIDKIIEESRAKALQEKLSRNEITGGTFTITNLGMYEVDFFTPIINPPEAAILGVGKIAEKPVARGGKVEIRQTMMLSLSYDHRIVDGAPAAAFLRKLKENIEKGLEF
jgi:pyruvate dehydrogenase E2 component (dihydrolipoamide acetyltransferase)